MYRVIQFNYQREIDTGKYELNTVLYVVVILCSDYSTPGVMVHDTHKTHAQIPINNKIINECPKRLQEKINHNDLHEKCYSQLEENISEMHNFLEFLASIFLVNIKSTKI